MKKFLVALALASFAGGLFAQPMKLAGGGEHKLYFPTSAGTPTNNHVVLNKANLTNHGGGVIASPHVVFIFWGPSFASGGADNAYATTLQAFRNQFGSTGEWKTINQYGVAFPATLNGGTADWFDTSTPPVPVSDSAMQAKVAQYLTTHTFDNSAIYEIVTPSSTYADDGTGANSCGGPNLAYCAYHWYFTSGSNRVKYSIQPWPGCSGCKVSGWSNVQNQEHFVTHETREAATDPYGSTWYDSTGNEADDKCAWSPTPFLAGGYGYQYEWSNADSKCVQIK